MWTATRPSKRLSLDSEVTPHIEETRSGVGEGEIGSRARLRTSGLPSTGTGSIDPATGKAYFR